jgi:hypothetical protein
MGNKIIQEPMRSAAPVSRMMKHFMWWFMQLFLAILLDIHIDGNTMVFIKSISFNSESSTKDKTYLCLYHILLGNILPRYATE